MKKVCVVYASMSGNTEDIADKVRKAIQKSADEEAKSVEVTLIEMENFPAVELLDYDGLLLGSYTWGDGELPYEAEELYDQLNDIDLTGKAVGCFGSGDHAYPQFCAAVDIFKERAEERGGTVLEETLKIELAPESEEDKLMCVQFSTKFFELLMKESAHVE